VIKVPNGLAVDTSATRVEVMTFVWAIRIEMCNKMIPEKVFNMTFNKSSGKLVLVIGRELQS